MANYKRVVWVHSDERGKAKYPSLTALGVALGVNRGTAWKYVSVKGWTKDTDIIPRGRPRKVGRKPSSKKLYFEAVLGRIKS